MEYTEYMEYTVVSGVQRREKAFTGASVKYTPGRIQ